MFLVNTMMEYIPAGASISHGNSPTITYMSGITGWPQRLNQRFETLKAEKRLSQESLAVKLNVKQPTVSRWLKGKRTPSLEQFELLAAAIGTPLEWLMFGDVEKVTKDERDLLNSYRIAPENTKSTIRNVAHIATGKTDPANSGDNQEEKHGT